MEQAKLFAAALGLTAPWSVSDIRFSATDKRLDISLDFARGSTFACPECGASSKAYDTRDETWRHLDFFQHAAYLRARVPRVDCAQCGVKKIAVPWARADSGFTLLFEALLMQLLREMPVRVVAHLVNEHDTRLWRVLHHYVERARAQADYGEVTRIGVDETAARRGHHYISLFVDLEAKRVLFATPGKDSQTVQAFTDDLAQHGGAAHHIREVACDMSPAFTKGVADELPHAEITYDRFHVMQLLGAAVDQVRREEVRTKPELKGTRYWWLSNADKLRPREQSQLDALRQHQLKTGRAYALRLGLQELYQQTDRASGAAYLKRWYFWATHSRLEPMKKVARTIKAHGDGILNWFHSQATTGLLEGINSLVQAAKARARGYRSTRNLIAMAYLLAGKLHFELPT